jgi:hypothetical protein
MMTRVTITLMVLMAMTAACSKLASTTQTPGKESAAVASATPVAAGEVDITFTSDPTTPTTGDNAFEVRVMQAGRLVNDAEVSVEFVMPPMPQMKMPEMRTKTPLSPAGNGLYRGKGQVMMAGTWHVTLTATRNGQPLGSKTLTVTSK